MINDAKNSLAMAGVIGSNKSAVNLRTKNILLESAYFIPSSVAKTSKLHGIVTESSYRYARGVNPNGTYYALQRAVELIIDISGGKLGCSLVDIYPSKIEPKTVKVLYNNITKLLGQTIEKTKIHSILQHMGMQIGNKSEESFTVHVPTWKHSVTREVDIIEEIVRIHGYETADKQSSLNDTSYNVENAYNTRYKVATLLANNSYYEVKTKALTAKNEDTFSNDTVEAITVEKPSSQALSSLKVTSLSEGLQVVAHNINRGQTNLKLFEFGKKYLLQNNDYKEKEFLAIWLSGNYSKANWLEKSRPSTIDDLKSVVHAVLTSLGIDEIGFSINGHKNMLEYGVDIIAKNSTHKLGFLGKVSNALLNKAGISQNVFFAELNWQAITFSRPNSLIYKPVSKFPHVIRDLSIVIDGKISFEDVKNSLSQSR